MKETGNNFPMENQNLSSFTYYRVRRQREGARRDLPRVLNYVTVQGIVTDVFDQVMTKKTDPGYYMRVIFFNSCTVLNRRAAAFLNERNSVVFFSSESALMLHLYVEQTKVINSCIAFISDDV